MVWTATGEHDLDELGPVLTHEHLFINLMAERRGDGLINDTELVTSELSVFADQGGGTIFDLTTAELTVGSSVNSSPDFTAAVPGQTRDPTNVAAVQEVSRATGIKVVLGAGRYRDPFIDQRLVDRQGADRLAEEIVRDLEEGIPGTGVRAGLIGEVGADKWYVSAVEERCLRAAARAQVRTGVPVYTHAARWPVGREQLDILIAEGVDPAQVAIGHVDTVPLPGYAVSLAERGVFVGIDTINSARPSEVDARVALVMELVRAGHLEQVLLAHDVCLTSQLRAFGGNGFGFVLGEFRQALLAAGLDSGEFEQIVNQNPIRLLGR